MLIGWETIRGDYVSGSRISCLGFSKTSPMHTPLSDVYNATDLLDAQSKRGCQHTFCNLETIRRN